MRSQAVSARRRRRQRLLSASHPQLYHRAVISRGNLVNCSSTASGSAFSGSNTATPRQGSGGAGGVGSDFADFPFERTALPRLSSYRRSLRFLSFACVATALSLTYTIFIARCVQNGRVLDDSVETRVDIACVGGITAAFLLLLISAIVQLMDNRRHPSGGEGDGSRRSCCRCVSRNREDSSPDTVVSEMAIAVNV